MLVDGVPVSASLFDFGLYLFHNGAEALRARERAVPLPAQARDHHEARLWNEVFVHGQDALGIPRGSIRATVLIETILAAFEMDEILYELREHAAGLNAGRWDYLFSVIKKLPRRPGAASCRTAAQLTMTVPFMRAYTRAARRDLPPARRARDRRDGGVHPEPARPGGHRTALAKVRDDKERESGRRLRRHVGRPSGPRAGRDAEVFDRRAGRPAEPEGPAARGGRGRRRPTLLDLAVAGGAGHRGRRPREHPGRARSTSTRGCAASARPRSTT